MMDWTALRVYIGVPTAEQGRYAMFNDYMNFLIKPNNTIGASFHTNSAAKNRNLIIDDALAHNATHILFVDDDMAFHANSLCELLDRDVDVVSGLYFSRVYPHKPILFDTYPGGMERHYLQDGESGLIEVGAVGFGFLLVKTHVFNLLDQPYVRHGELDPDRRTEDVGFCQRLRAAGFKIYCDLDVPIGHMAMATIWPSKMGNKWHTAIDTNGNNVLLTAQEKSEILTPLTK